MPNSLSHATLSFPSYLVQPFRYRARARKSSSATDSSTGSCSLTDDSNAYRAQQRIVSPTTGPVVSSHTSLLRCTRCLADLIFSDQIISKGFMGRWGQAYLVSPTISPVVSPPTRDYSLPNTILHEPVKRDLATGPHTVSDMSCIQCGRILGWKYVAAEEEAQKYKVGKFVLEANRVCKIASVDHAAWDVYGSESADGGGDAASEAIVEFDSQDEDECDDLFAGIWTPRRAAKRRRARIGTG